MDSTDDIISPEAVSVVNTETVNPDNQATVTDQPPSMAAENDEALKKPSLSETVASGSAESETDTKRRAVSPVRSVGSPSSGRDSQRGSVTTALRAHGERMTWPSDWERTDNDITAANPKFTISIVSPEIVSSMMTK